MAKNSGNTNFSRIVIVASLMLLTIFAIVIIVRAYGRSHPRDAYGFYWQGVKSLNARNYVRAEKILAEAARLSGTNSGYFQAAAQAALARGGKQQARLYAEKAWDLGSKTPEQFNFILGTFDGRDRTNELRQAVTMLDQLPPDLKSAELRGNVFFFFSRIDEAIRTWEQVLAQNHSPDLVVKIAHAYSAVGQKQRAVEILEKHRRAGELNETGYSELASLYLGDDALFSRALTVFEEARDKGHYGEGIQLEHAAAYLINQRAAEAQSILESLAAKRPDQDTNRFRTSARLFLSVIYVGQTNRSGLNYLLSQGHKAEQGPIREGEELFYRSQLRLLNKTANVLDDLRNSRRIIPDHAAIQLLFASQSNATGSPAEALEACRSIHGIMAHWPAVQLECALALHKMARDAEALRVLDQVHRRGFVSKESLALLRDAAFETRQTQRGQTTQSMLETRFPTDPEIKFYSGYSALRQRHFDKAGAIFEELSGRFPTESRYKLAQIQVLLAKGEARPALEAMRNMEAKPELMAPLMGIAYARLQDWKQAAASFETALMSPQPAPVHVEYGMVLLQMNQAPEATRQFEQAFAKDPKQLDARLGLALAAYSQGDLEAARRQGALLANNPEMDVSRLLFLAVSEMRFEQFTNALEYCRLALLKDPNSADARAIRGTALGSVARFGEAEQDLIWAATKKPADLAVRQELARVYLRAEQYPKALATAGQVLAVSPNDRAVQGIKFDALVRSRQFGAAQAFLSILETSWPASQVALASAFLAERKGDKVHAVALLSPHLTNIPAALQWGRLQFEAGHGLSAVERLRSAQLNAGQWGGLAALAEGLTLTNVVPLCYLESLKLDPNNPILLNNWAWSAAQLPDFDPDKAVLACRRAYAAMPRNPTVMDTYAEVLLRARRYDDCVSLLEANPSVVNRTPQLLWSLGNAYQGINDREKALDTYQRCQELLKKNPSGLRVNAGEIPKRIEQLRPRR
jgi:tetratricopeptide (TPR) repeat protein